MASLHWFPSRYEDSTFHRLIIQFFLDRSGHATAWMASSATADLAVVLAIDAGTTSIRAAFVSASAAADHGGAVVLASHSVPITTTCSANGFAEQSPLEWSVALKAAIKHAASALPPPYSATDVKAVSLVATTCTLVAVGKDMQPVRDALLWSDVRAAAQAELIFNTHHPHITAVTRSGWSTHALCAATVHRECAPGR